MSTGSRANAWCLLIHAEISFSAGNVCGYNGTLSNEQTGMGRVTRPHPR